MRGCCKGTPFPCTRRRPSNPGAQIVSVSLRGRNSPDWNSHLADDERARLFPWLDSLRMVLEVSEAVRHVGRARYSPPWFVRSAPLRAALCGKTK